MASYGHEHFGKYKGFVRATNDPERRGRIRCFCPQVMGPEDSEQFWLGWAEPCLPYVGGVTSLDFGIPLTAHDTGHEVPVWLEFEAGDADHPVWVGMGVYAPTTKDPELVKAPVSAQTGIPGLGLLGEAASAGPGSTEGSLSPPYAAPDQKDIIFLAKPGRRIVIGVEGGAMIVIDGEAVDIIASLPRINGKTFIASLDEIVG